MSPSNPKSSKNDEQSKSRLDLGLGGFLADDRPSGGRAPRVLASSASPAGEVVSEFSQLFEQGRYRDLVRLTEEEKDDGPIAKLERRLWWVRAQRALGELPISVLPAAIEELVQANRDQLPEGLKALTTEILRDLGEGLKMRGELELSVHCYEKAYRLDHKGKEALLATVAAEEGLLTLSAADRHNVRDRERRLALLGKLKAELKSAPQSEKADQQAKHNGVGRSGVARSSKAEISISDKSSKEKKSKTPNGAELQDSPAGFFPEPAGGFGKSGFRTAALAVVLFLLLAGAGYYYWQQHRENMGETVLPQMAQNQEPPVLNPPVVQKVGRVGYLSSILYQLEEGAGAEKAAISRDSTEVVSDVGDREQQVAQSEGRRPQTDGSNSAAGVSAGQAAAVKQVAVNTTTPVEPANLFAPSPHDRAESRDENNKREKPTPSAIVPGREMRRQPRSDSDSQTDGERRPSRERSARRFSVMVPTAVLSEPSFRAEILAELDRGDEIMVDGQEGVFLRLQSRKGKTGYILAQDAVED